MFKRNISTAALVIFLVFLTTVSCTRIPDQAGAWRVEVGPPGNEFYEVPSENVSQDIPPSEELLRVVQILAPSYTKVTDWKRLDENKYWIRSSAGFENYDYTIYTDGTIEDICYSNDSTRTREKAYYLLIKDSKKSISIDEVPQKALEKIRVLFPDSEPTHTWLVSTFAGKRYLVVVGEMAFYIRPDGQIQSARSIYSGALEENYPNTGDKKEIIAQIMAEAKKLLPDEVRDRFNIDNQIARLKSHSISPNTPFRFVVMGDSRSNPEFWKAVLRHIAAIRPRPAFVINSGDLVPRGLVKEFAEYFVPPLMDFDIPYLVAIGNHDCGYKGKALEYRYLFGENSLNYFFDYGNYRFVIIDNVSKAQPLSETVKWLDSILSTTPENYHKIVVAHSPFGNVEKWRYHVMDRKYSKAFGDLMVKHHVDHVFFGHIHAYSTATLNGINYTVSGGGGAGLHNRFGPKGNVHHYIICDVLKDGSMKQQVVRFYRDK